jgi:hypothetical protein
VLTGSFAFQKSIGGILLPSAPTKSNSDAHFGTVRIQTCCVAVLEECLGIHCQHLSAIMANCMWGSYGLLVGCSEPPPQLAARLEHDWVLIGLRAALCGKEWIVVGSCVWATPLGQEWQALTVDHSSACCGAVAALLLPLRNGGVVVALLTVSAMRGDSSKPVRW